MTRLRCIWAAYSMDTYSTPPWSALKNDRHPRASTIQFAAHPPWKIPPVPPTSQPFLSTAPSDYKAGLDIGLWDHLVRLLSSSNILPWVLVSPIVQSMGPHACNGAPSSSGSDVAPSGVASRLALLGGPPLYRDASSLSLR